MRACDGHEHAPRGEIVSTQMQVLMVLLVVIALLLGHLTNSVHVVMSGDDDTSSKERLTPPSWHGVWGSLLAYCLLTTMLIAQVLGGHATVVVGWVFGSLIGLTVVAFLWFCYRTYGQARLQAAFAESEAETPALVRTR